MGTPVPGEAFVQPSSEPLKAVFQFPHAPGQNGLPPPAAEKPIAILFHPDERSKVQHEVADIDLELVELDGLRVPALLLYADGSTTPWFGEDEVH